MYKSFSQLIKDFNLNFTESNTTKGKNSVNFIKIMKNLNFKNKKTLKNFIQSL